MSRVEPWAVEQGGRRSMATGEFSANGSTSEVEPPWFSHIEERNRGTAGTNAATWYDALDAVLAANLDDPPDHVGTFIHGYSGSNLPASFSSSSVAGAQSRGVGAMLNVKRPWSGLANGDYDDDIEAFFESWPVGVFGSVTMNHEPENDNPSGASNPSDPAYVSWANTNAPIWKDGLNRFIDVAAPIIRARGLDVKVGGCLMDFSWDNTRWQWWDWWEDVTPGNINEVAFQVDAYWRANNDGTLRDFRPRMETLLDVCRSANIPHFELWETNVSRANAYGSGATIVASVSAMTAWWQDYAAYLHQQPEVRMVCEYHLPTGFASQNSWLPGSSGANNSGGTLEAFANICVNGNRRGVSGG